MNKGLIGSRIRFLSLALLLLSIHSPVFAAEGEEVLPAVGDQEKPTDVLPLNLKQAVEIALGPDGSTRVQMAQELILQAKARSAQSLAALIPNVDASLSQQNQTRNLAAFGIHFDLPVPGFTMPTRTGPFNVFDVRATASQSLFDMSAIRRYQAARIGVRQSEAEKENTEDQVRQQTARAYLTLLKAEAALEAAAANTRLAADLLQLVQNQKDIGTGMGIEVTRAGVQLAAKQQQELIVRNERNRSRLQLLRVIGLTMATDIRLTEQLSYIPFTSPSPQQALQQALDSRADWKSQQKRLESIRMNRSAVKMERLPSVSLFGDYGSIGTGIDNNIATRTYGVAARIPLFDGGRRDARRAEITSQLRQEEIRSRDLRQQIELEIRMAIDNLYSAEGQVKVAEEAFLLAEKELAHARRRYQAGMGISLEVTDAQTRLEQARENRLSALYQHNLARIDLGSAMGTIRQMIP